jgi:putative aminopeptidase FrvX
MSLPPVDEKYLLDFLTRLLNTPSPTGFTDQAVEMCAQTLAALPGLQLTRTRKGALLAVWPGERADAPRAVTAHVDTLGAMVKEIKADGRLKLTQVGSYAWNSIEGEGCAVFPRKGEPVRGSILLTMASSHVHGAASSKTERDGDTLEVRLDAKVVFADEVRDLGLEVGDFVAFDPRVEVVNGFVRSRHLDDKASVAALVAALKALSEAGLKPRQTTYILVSNHEEVGHGSAGIPDTVHELLAVDMAAVGEGQESDEYHATLCVKDSSGPYDHHLSNRLRGLAEQNEIPYKVDIYPYYSSDAQAYWRQGGDAAVALIGPGVDASHNYERTHTEALTATARWIAAYLLSD